MAPRRFLKVGRVSARQLTERLTWQTKHGDVLQGEAGDWAVSGPDGRLRTVRDAEFRASHRHVDGDVWERIGEVRAWQTDRPVTVQTLEGEATAAPGDWIVTAADGTTWPVPDEEFQRGYRPV